MSASLRALLRFLPCHVGRPYRPSRRGPPGVHSVPQPRAEPRRFHAFAGQERPVGPLLCAISSREAGAHSHARCSSAASVISAPARRPHPPVSRSGSSTTGGALQPALIARARMHRSIEVRSPSRKPRGRRARCRPRSRRPAPRGRPARRARATASLATPEVFHPPAGGRGRVDRP